MKEKRLLPLFLSQSLRSAAVSLLSFFSVIYIYKQTQSFLAVFGLYFLLYVFKLIGIFLAQELSLKYGLKAQIVIGNILTALSLICYFLSQNNLYLLILAVIYWGTAIGFFWFGRHGLMIKLCPQNRFGHALGTSLSVGTFFYLAIPFLGGLIINEFGYHILFLSTLVFIFLALITLLPLKDEAIHQETTLRETLKLLWSHKRMSLAYVSSGFVDTVYSEGLLLYIFLFIKKELKLGIFLTLSMIVVAAINYLICNLIDRRDKRHFVGSGSILNSFAWLGRFLSRAYLPLFIFDIIGRVGGGMVGYPMEVLSYQKAIAGQSTSRAIIFRELAITGGSILAILILGGVSFLKLPLKLVFLLTAVVSLSKLLILNKELK